MSETTVYGKPGCVQCKYTTKLLDAQHLSYNYVDISKNVVAEQHVKDMGFNSLPVVVAGQSSWSGFNVDKIRGLPND